MKHDDYEAMIEGKDRCWCFSPEMERCEGIAGHDGSHFVNRVWTDNEAWTPIKPPTPAVPRWDTTPEVEHLVTLPDKCELCEHPWHDGPCTAMDGEFECDCRMAV